MDLRMNPLDKLASKVFKSNTKRLKESKKTFEATESPDSIHDMRVASRRLLAAFNAFKNNLPDLTKENLKQMENLKDKLGKLRDLDLFHEYIAKLLSEKDLTQTKFEAQHKKLQKKLHSFVHSHKIKSLLGFLKDLKVKKDRNDPIEFGKKSINTALKRVFKKGHSVNPKTDDVTLHHLRIAFKKLRYTTEIFEEVLKKSFDIAGLTRLLVQIQDVLGGHQDAIIGLNNLEKYKNDFSSKEYQKIKKRYLLDLENTRNTFFKIWPQFIKIKLINK